ncbi:4059_t:CDS:2 [Entrophospora sp. SA101]|nr:4059_t:CDS:2 [Entrophospora sp. SA101]
MDLENNFFLEDDGLSEKDMELENSNSYNDDNNSDYDPLELS